MYKLIVLFLIILCSCGGLKKASTVSVVRDSLTVQIHTVVNSQIDTSKTVNTTTQIVNIIYDSACDSAKVVIEGKVFTGKIKSANVTTITKKLDQNGVTKIDSTVNAISVHKIITDTKVKTDVAQSPYKWLWILLTVLGVLGILLFAYYQIKPLLTAFKPIEWVTGLFKH